MRIVFVIAPFRRSEGYGSARKVPWGQVPSLGIAYLAAVAEARGHVTALVDAMNEDWDYNQAVDAVVEARPDVIGLSCLATRNAEAAYALASKLKARLPDVPLVMGGAHVTSFPLTILSECPSVDILVPGEGEYVFANLVDRFQDGRDYRDLEGILYRDAAGKTVATAPAACARDTDAIPFPARHIWGENPYVPLPTLGLDISKPSTLVLTSRGCSWNRCRFCYRGGVYAPVYRRRSPANVVAEIEMLANDLGIRNIRFYDDNFTINMKWITAFCDLLDQADLKVEWSVLGRVDTSTEPMLRRIAASGCKSVQFGFESGNQELLDLIDKGITLEQSRQAVRWARAAGISVTGAMIVGLPTETPAMSEKTFRFACELNADHIYFVPYIPMPGTRLAEIAMAEGKLIENRRPISLLEPSYLPKTYPSVEALDRFVRSAHRRYYARPRYLARALWNAVRHPVMLKNYVYTFEYWSTLTLVKPLFRRTPSGKRAPAHPSTHPNET